VALSSSENFSDSEAGDGCEEDEPYRPDGDLLSSEEDVGVGKRLCTCGFWQLSGDILLLVSCFVIFFLDCWLNIGNLWTCDNVI